MFNICIKYHKYRTYTQSAGCIAVGKAFYQGKLYEGDEFCTLVSSWSVKENFVKGIQDLNGFYALISQHDNRLFVAVDRVRSIPLFYAQKADEFYLSDCADWVREQVSSVELDPISKEEFLLTGYVTGPDTLFPNVKQIQAGECLFVEDAPPGISVHKQKYFQYIHNYPDSVTEEELLTKHDQVLVNIFNRLIEIADGSTIVVPLSGGYDSRLIVLMLKNLGYQKVIAFSYGRPGNLESVVSRQVAENLGIQWEFVEYRNDLWYEWYRSYEYRMYANFADGCTSLPHIQDWPAVWYLKKNNKIPQDSIFVPGHSADLLAGSRSTSLPSLYRNQKTNATKTIKEILRYHYSLFHWEKEYDRLQSIFIGKIKQTIGNLEQFPDNASAFESWDIAERQAKFIINSLRVYEFWGYEWWIPFWDYEYINYWSRICVNYRINKRLYNRCITQYEKKILGYNLELNKKTLTQIIKSIILDSPLDSVGRIVYNIVKARLANPDKEYDSHPLAWYGIIDRSSFARIYTGKETINSFLARDYFLE